MEFACYTARSLIGGKLAIVSLRDCSVRSSSRQIRVSPQPLDYSSAAPAIARNRRARTGGVDIRNIIFFLSREQRRIVGPYTVKAAMQREITYQVEALTPEAFASFGHVLGGEARPTRESLAEGKGFTSANSDFWSTLDFHPGHGGTTEVRTRTRMRTRTRVQSSRYIHLRAV